ncbi:hypothetical protein [Cedecea lapagei]|uniref:hypothetical protein n=1 Tax=Cedecea lapagei TaxID=158823 RepID=UPI001BCD763B|nr:hypothetical protein [Cedecea lapagei]
MARNNDSIRVEIEGDSTGLTRALRDSQNSLDKFSKSTSGTLSSVSKSLSGSLGKISSAGSGIGMAFSAASIATAAAGAVIVGTMVAVQKASEKAFEVFQSASLAGTNVENIQRMANMYREVGLTMENIADQQKDLKDKLGDAINNQAGSMYTDIIKPLKLNILELKKMADAGEDVYAKIYYAAKAQGYSATQMTNIAETLGNDAVKRVPVLEKFNSLQEYQNALAHESVQLTSQQSDQFKKYRDATAALSNAWQSWNNEVLAPIAEKLAEIINKITAIINTRNKMADVATEWGKMSPRQILKDEEDYQKVVKEKGEEEAKRKTRGLATLRKHNDATIAEAKRVIEEHKNLEQSQQAEANKAPAKGYEKHTLDNSIKTLDSAKDKLRGQLEDVEHMRKNIVQGIQDSIFTAYGGNMDKMQADIDLANKKAAVRKAEIQKQIDADDVAAKSKADAAAKAAAAAAERQAAQEKRLNDEQIRARKDLDKILVDMTVNSTDKQLKEFDRQQVETTKAIEKNAAILKIKGQELQDLLTAQVKAGVEQRKKLLDEIIGYQDQFQGTKDINALLGTGELDEKQKEFLRYQQQQRVSDGSPFGEAAESKRDKALKDNQEELQLELAQNDLLLKGHEDYEKRKAEITLKYNTQAMQIQEQFTQAQIGTFTEAATSMTTAMTAAFGEQSGAAKAAFAVQRGLSIAQTILSIQTAMAQALATPFPASLAAYAQVASMGMKIISTAKGANAGQFHGGVDDIPNSLNNKSFVLKAGERVVQPEANKKLTSFLDDQDKSGGRGDIVVNAPLIVQGSIDDDAKFTEMAKKHASIITQAVKNEQRRTT